MTRTPDDVDEAQLSASLGYRFTHRALALEALTHRSWCAENDGGTSNERLELLGDSVLGLVVTDHIFRTYVELSEGDLARIRASLVNTTTLADLAEEIGLGRFLLLGRGEHLSGGREKPSILADALEAVIGAIYIESGQEAAGEFVLRLLGSRVPDAADGPGDFDAKTRLQELVAGRGDGTTVAYVLEESGPDHAKAFRAEVLIDGDVLGSGEGKSKKRAEQVAAREACARLTTSS